MIKIGVKGRIIQGKYSPQGEVIVDDDSKNTGGYLVYIWPNDGTKWPGSDEDMVWDDWLENYEQVVDYFKDSNWVIKWPEDATEEETKS